ncbi:MAG: ABC transporter substrate-binding protein, partial [Coriobacteriia bacterium]|nr:ABC transporter substrate-binding protein [Coriobacteriia bacterium]
TAIGLVNMMSELAPADAPAQIITTDDAPDSYSFGFSVYGTADELVPKLISGDIDIALLPANLASVVYNRTGGGISVIDINTLGVLYVVSADDSISSLQDLAGRTLLMTGKGMVPEYVVQYLLEQNGLTDQVTIEFKSEATELAAVINSDPTAIALLPEPYVSVVTGRNPALVVRVDLTEEWNLLGTEGQLITGVTVVRNDFLAEHPNIVWLFITHHLDSVFLANTDPVATAEHVVAFGIIDDAEVAARAIPRCNLVCLVDVEMQQALGSYLEVLYQANPESIGGKLPENDFYYYTQAR